MGGYLKARQKVDWESESRRPEIFSQPMMMNVQGRDRPCDVTVRRVVPAPWKVGKDESSFSMSPAAAPQKLPVQAHSSQRLQTNSNSGFVISRSLRQLTLVS
jgi:hypothetical protein